MKPAVMARIRRAHAVTETCQRQKRTAKLCGFARDLAAVMPGQIMFAKLDPDLPIDARRHGDGKMRPHRQVAISHRPAGIEGLRKIEKPADGIRHIAA